MLSFASLSIRPVFLTLLEKHVIFLDSSILRPALRALLLCILPGLEEESSEDFDRALKMLDDIRESVKTSPDAGDSRLEGFGDEYFWQCLFLAAVGGVSRRQGTLSYLFKRLPKLEPSKSYANGAAMNEGREHPNNDEDSVVLSQAAEGVVSPEPGLLIRCFVAGLEDDQPLIQRGFLDLLLSHLPLHSPVLINRVGDQDLERLVCAATTVVARRDMSLNRRLWTWFLGPDRSEHDSDAISPTMPMLPDRKDNKNVEYFTRFGLRPLSESIIHMFEQPNSSVNELMKPYRISLSLLDRWEIGNALIPKLFVSAFDCLLMYRNRASPADYHEVLRSASALFDGIESGLLWTQIVALLGSALGKEPLLHESRDRRLKLVSFIIQSFNIRDEEMMALHVPLACVVTLSRVADRQYDSDFSQLTGHRSIIESGLLVAEQLIEQMPERTQLNSSFGQNIEKKLLDDDIGRHRHHVINSVSKFYKDTSGDPSSSPPPLSSQEVAVALLRVNSEMFTQAVSKQESVPILTTRARLLAGLLSKTPNCHGMDLSRLCEQCRTTLALDRKLADDFRVTTSVAWLLVRALGKSSPLESHEIRRSNILPLLISRFWSYLGPATPKFHVESVRMLWQLDSADPRDNILESSISRFVSRHAAGTNVGEDAEPARRFAILWTHSMNISLGAQRRGSIARSSSTTTKNGLNAEAQDHQTVLIRPLLLVLEGLRPESSELYSFLVSWLKSASILFTVFDVLIVKIASLERQQNKLLTRDMNCTDRHMKTLHDDRIPECCYYLKHIYNLLRLSLESLRSVLAAQGTPIADASQDSDETLESNAICMCLNVVELGFSDTTGRNSSACSEMQCLALSILQQLFVHADHLITEAKRLEHSLLNLLGKCTDSQRGTSSVQVALLDTTMSYLKSRYTQRSSKSTHHRKVSSIDTPPLGVLQRSSVDKSEEKHANDVNTPPPAQLLKRLQEGITSSSSRSVVENWVTFLNDVLPLYAHSLFQNLIPLVETFYKQINSNFERLKRSFVVDSDEADVIPENSLISLLNGLENTLAVAHDRLAFEENASAGTKAPDSPQGFFGNVVSGVFSSEVPKGRQSSANSRLTVVLCFQDTVRICFSIWSWAAYGQEDGQVDPSNSASFSYSSSRMRNRARRLLDRMFTAETLECLETLVAPASAVRERTKGIFNSNRVISLLQTLEGSRPSRLVPAIFNSLYSRTNPSALEPSRMSSLTSDVKDGDLGVFLVDYTRSLDNDAMDEIWVDCMIFLKDVLSNPLIHSSILPYLLLFVQTLAEKVDKTNFGEQRKMRKELSDLFQRLLQATFASRPAGVLHDPGDGTGTAQSLSVIDVLTTVMPKLHVILPESDKQLSAVTHVSNGVFGPLTHTKQFPENVTLAHFTLLHKVVRISAAAKVWRKDIAELYNHTKIFALGSILARSGLAPILRQWGLVERDRFSDTLNRVPAPTTAGIMFGVGANAARLEADKKAQLNLRRATFLALALDADAVVPHMATLLEKLTEMLSASVTSSPSSATRAEVFLLVQAVVLKTSAVHLSSLWPIVSSELQKAIASASFDGKEGETYNAFSLLQACRLLDLLLLVGPDDFQMHAWLFVNDTIDAVYGSNGSDHANVALVDEIAERLNQGAPQTPGPGLATPVTPDLGRRRSGDDTLGAGRAHETNGFLLDVTAGSIVGMSKDEVVRTRLRPWFAQLSLQSFEREYSMKSVDWEGCRAKLFDELFDEETMVG